MHGTPIQDQALFSMGHFVRPSVPSHPRAWMRIVGPACISSIDRRKVNFFFLPFSLPTTAQVRARAGIITRIVAQNLCQLLRKLDGKQPREQQPFFFSFFFGFFSGVE